jgi:hypothetical protein
MDILTNDHRTARPSTDEMVTMSRRQLASYLQTVRYSLGQMFGETTAFGGARRYYKVLGYNESPSVADYRQRYDRQDIAGRVVDLPAQDSWKRPPKISEDGNTETAFVQAWDELRDIDRLGVWNRLMRVDKLSGIGSFGVLLLGLRDGAELEEPVERSLSGPSDVLYLRPFSQENARIKEFDLDAKSERFGLPAVYEIKLGDTEDWTPVHWQRIIHVAEDTESNEVYGKPRLKGIYNRLDDLIKLVGGTAEANWWAMRPGTALGLKEGYKQTMTDTEIEEEIEDMTHDPMRIAFLTGIEATPIGEPTLLDNKNPVEVCLALIAARSGIPQRVLVGSAQGELAAAKEDRKQWADEIDARQKNYVEPNILRRFINHLIVLGVLPEPAKGYDVGEQDKSGEWHWPSILQPTDAERAEIATAYANAAKALSDPLAFYPIAESEKRVLLDHPEDRPEEVEPERRLPVQEPIQAQQVRVIPEGSELPPLDVPDEVIISDTDKEQGIADWRRYMRPLAWTMDAEVEGQEEYDGEQY